MSIQDKLAPTGQKKLLALDGGGIRGMITLEYLAEIEALLRQRLDRGPDFVLADWFDYVAGTSTGAIIATCIALGMPVDTIRQFYEANGRAMFDKASLLKRFRYKYEDDRLAAKLRDVIRAQAGAGDGKDPTLGSEKLRTLLMLVLRNATTDSPWPICNNPAAHYNRPDRADCNLHLPLWQLVRASTAAPVYFPPEVVAVGQHEFVFVDGGVTTYNNPAFALFLMATLEPYRLQWPTGEQRMLLVSVGTGSNPKANENLDPDEMNILFHAGSVPSALMFAALNQQDMLCRVFGRCRAGAVLDREIGDLHTGSGPVEPRLFTYMRYNCELSRESLDGLGLGHIDPGQVQQMDSIEYLPQLRQVGRSAAASGVRPEHFDGFV
jgi:hypothetical protein